MEKALSPLLEIPLPDGTSQTFDNLGAVNAWVKREELFWNWLEKIAPSSLALTEDQRPILIKNLRQAKQILLTPNPPDASNLGAVKAALSLYAKKGLASEMPRAAYITDLRSRFGDIVAAAAVAEYLGSTFGTLQNVAIEDRHKIETGRFANVLFDFALGKSTAGAYRSTYEKLTGEFKGRAEQQFAAARLELATIKAEREEASRSRDEWKAQSEKSWEGILERINVDANGALENISNTEKAFKEQMKLRASVKYWSGQSGIHTKRGHWQKLILLGYAIAVCVICQQTLPGAFDFVKTTAIDLEGKSSTPLFILAGSGIFVVSVALWIARILVRVYAEERHRALDASERAVMAETYSALTAEGLVTEAERVLVLSTMFRPAGESPNKEDGPETLQHAILAKLLDSRTLKTN